MQKTIPFLIISLLGVGPLRAATGAHPGYKIVPDIGSFGPVVLSPRQLVLQELSAHAGKRRNERARNKPYYHSYKNGNYLPDARPVTYWGPHIIAMTPRLWTPRQIFKDFKRRNKLAEKPKKGVVIILKTEFCHANIYRPCAVTSLVFKHQSEEAVKEFYIYMAWIKDLSPNFPKRSVAKWHRRLDQTYGFRQGPGANIFVRVQKKDKTWHAVRSHGVGLGLMAEPLWANNGAAPKLQEFLSQALADAQ